ncbi:MAG: hypothetical protein AAB381_03230 [Patescibacteria group bacterium]
MASGIEFDEDKFNYSSKPQPNGVGGPAVQSGYAPRGAGGIVGWLISKGWAKNEASANIILLVLVVINIIITILVIRLFL